MDGSGLGGEQGGERGLPSESRSAASGNGASRLTPAVRHVWINRRTAVRPTWEEGAGRLFVCASRAARTGALISVRMSRLDQLFGSPEPWFGFVSAR
jgi:hypothetical protein